MTVAAMFMKLLNDCALDRSGKPGRKQIQAWVAIKSNLAYMEAESARVKHVSIG